MHHAINKNPDWKIRLIFLGFFSYPGGFNFSTAEALVDARQYFPGLKVEKMLAGSEVSGHGS
jgi:hypothetical protein